MHVLYGLAVRAVRTGLCCRFSSRLALALGGEGLHFLFLETRILS